MKVKFYTKFHKFTKTFSEEEYVKTIEDLGYFLASFRHKDNCFLVENNYYLYAKEITHFQVED